jgi:hypothetical protein
MMSGMGVNTKRAGQRACVRATEDDAGIVAARRKFKAVVHVVVAANRIRVLEREWRRVRELGDGLRRVREGRV